MTKRILIFSIYLLFVIGVGMSPVAVVAEQKGFMVAETISDWIMQASVLPLSKTASPTDMSLEDIRRLAQKTGATNFYGATALTGGATGALDAIDGAGLATGDTATTITSSTFYIYYLDASSAAAESSPTVISPDSNAGDKRWLLIFSGDAAMAGITDTYIPYFTTASGYLDSPLTSDGTDVTNSGDLTVSGGDVTINGTDPATTYDVTLASETDYWTGVTADGGGDDNDKFQIGKGTTPGTTPYLTVDKDGNVGIGTTSPGAQFDVQGAAGTAGTQRLSTAELTVVDGDELGRVDFNAPLESDGTDAIAVAASIWAEADDTFSATVNTTDLVFAVAVSGVATEKMRLTSAGVLEIAGGLQITPASAIAGLSVDMGTNVAQGLNVTNTDGSHTTALAFIDQNDISGATAYGLHVDSENDSASAALISGGTNDGSSDILQLTDSDDSEVFTVDTNGNIEATSFTAYPTSAPGISMVDSDGADNDVSGKIYNNLTTTGTGVEVGDLYFQVMQTGTLTTFAHWDGSETQLNINGSLRADRMSVLTKTADYTLTSADFGKSHRMNSASDRNYTLPSVGATEDGARLTFIKQGTGRMTLTAVDSDTLHDSSAAGTIYTTTLYATITIEYVHGMTRWVLISASGTFTTT